ncbi:unnamed protein product [Clonostachys rosea]|uniref:Uncharacterized protein n=1 Tax=Bionectria ochroleuca TaxID=29856 RepID=A0ABY6UF17_BIOOC|nr:unnamed protein product [Clonostachys rosea]
MSEKSSSALNSAEYAAPPAPPIYEEVDSTVPAYHDEVIPPSSRSSKPHLFPTEFTLSYRLGRSLSFLYKIKDQPLYAIKTPRVATGWTEIVLLNGTDKLSAPLASASVEKGSKTARTNLRLMPRPNGSYQEPIDISMSGNYSMRHQFSLPTGPGGEEESFEWRSSKGRLIKDLVGGFQFGAKLVRLSGPTLAPTGNGSSDNEDDREMDGITSDGKSVVAIYAGERWHYSQCKFRFINEGATGQLGEVFELAAVMSFVRLFEVQIAAGLSASYMSASSSSAAAAASA